MEDRNNIWTGVTLVALVGGAITFLLYTDRGRQTLRRIEDSLDDFGSSLQDLRGAVQKVGRIAAQGIDVASEGMEVVSGILGKAERRQGSGVTH